MAANNLLTYTIKIMGEIVFDVFYFPVWWYSRGTLITLNKLFYFLRNQERSWGLFVWIKNIFRPMYGQTDLQGRLISVFIRLVQIIFRGAIMLVITLITFIMFLVWLIAPVFIVFEIIFQFL